MLLREIKSVFHQKLDAIYGREEVNSFFYMLIEHYLHIARFAMALTPELHVDKEEETLFLNALRRLRKQEPIQYILGTAHFMEMEFQVNSDVLIPRPETEELVRWIISEIRSETIGQTPKTMRILDLGTGSGCIAVGLAKQLPGAEVYGIDISAKALQVARSNAKANGVIINFEPHDIFDLRIEGAFDIIVSNPPYVRQSEKGEMCSNVLHHEPALALFVPDANPLLYYKAIAEFAMGHLKPSGSLFFEINQYLATETKKLLHDHNFSEIDIRKDLFGNDRMLKGTFIKSA